MTSEDIHLPSVLNVEFQFRVRPQSVPAEFRPLWRIALVLLCLRYSRGRQASLQKLYVLNWAVKSEGTRSRFQEFLASDSSTLPLFGVEQTMDLAIALCLGEGLIETTKSGSLKITLEGEKLVSEIEEFELFKAERMFLDAIGPKALEKNVNEILTLGVSE